MLTFNMIVVIVQIIFIYQSVQGLPFLHHLDLELLDEQQYCQLILNITDLDLSSWYKLQTHVSGESTNCQPKIEMRELQSLDNQLTCHQSSKYQLIKNPEITFLFWNTKRQNLSEFFSDKMFQDLPYKLPQQPYFFVLTQTSHDTYHIEEIQVYIKSRQTVLTIEPTKTSKTTVWARRSNFQGYKLKTYFENTEPWGYFDHGNFVGYNGELGSMVAKKLNLTLDLKPIKVWGLKTNNGTYTGTIQDFKNNETDIGMASYIQIAERLEVTDAGYTSLKSTTEMFYWKHDNAVVIFGLVFRPSLWLALLISILVSTLLLFIKLRMFQSNFKHHMIYQFLRALVTNLTSIVVLDIQGNYYQSPSVRIHVLSMALCGALLFWTYSGVLVSYFSSDSEARPIESLEDLINVPNLKIWIANGTSYHQHLIRAIGERPDLEEAISRRIVLKETFNGPEEEFRKSQDSNSAIFGSTLDLLHALFTRKKHSTTYP